MGFREEYYVGTRLNMIVLGILIMCIGTLLAFERMVWDIWLVILTAYFFITLYQQLLYEDELTKDYYKGGI